MYKFAVVTFAVLAANFAQADKIRVPPDYEPYHL